MIVPGARGRSKARDLRVIARARYLLTFARAKCASTQCGWTRGMAVHPSGTERPLERAVRARVGGRVRIEAAVEQGVAGNLLMHERARPSTARWRRREEQRSVNERVIAPAGVTLRDDAATLARANDVGSALIAKAVQEPGRYWPMLHEAATRRW